MPTKWLARSLVLNASFEFGVPATISVASVFIPTQKISNASRSRYWLAPLEHSIRFSFRLTREIWQRNVPINGMQDPETASQRAYRSPPQGLRSISQSPSPIPPNADSSATHGFLGP